MNSRKSFYDIKSFYNKKAKLKAGFKGMRYQVEQTGDSDGVMHLKASVWPEPFCYEKTPDRYKLSQEFAYNESGLDDAYNWICTCYENDTRRWEHALKFPLDSAREMGII